MAKAEELLKQIEMEREKAFKTAGEVLGLA
jgi:hypothetical protein